MNVLKYLIISLAIYGCEKIQKSNIPEEIKYAKKDEPLEESLLDNPILHLKVNEIVIYKPKEKFHINLDAPSKCGAYAVLEKTPRHLKCQFRSSGEHQLTVGICDEKETFCKIEKKLVKVEGEDLGLEFQPKPYTAKVKIPLPPGFILNDPKKALEILNEKKNLILIDFFGIWCPPCNMLDEYVFDTPTFVNSTKNMVKIKVDVDSEQSWEWKDKYKIQGYPTLIIANYHMEEIGRLVGYRNLDVVLDWIEKQKAIEKDPIIRVKYLIDNDKVRDRKRYDKLRFRLGMWHLDRNENQEALVYLNGLKTIEAKKGFLTAELNIASAKDDNSKMKEIYQILLKDYSAEIESGSWLSDFLELDKDLALPYVDNILKNIDAWKSSPKLKDYDWSLGDLAVTKASILETLEKKEDSKKEYLIAADYYQSLLKNSKLKTPRGANQELAYSLYKGEKLDEAKKIYEMLVKEYDTEFTFNYYYARLLLKTKEPLKAYPYAKKSLSLSYGDNWLKSVALKAEIEMELKKKNEAKKTLQTALDEVRIPKVTEVGTHRLISSLRSLMNKAQAL